MTGIVAPLGRSTLSLILAAAVSGATPTAASGASAAVRHPTAGGLHAGGFDRGIEHRGFGRMAVGRGGRGRGLGGLGGFDSGDFGGGRVGTGLAAAGLALGVVSAMASTAAEQQTAAQPRCGMADQAVLRPNGTYFYRKVQVCD